MERLIAQFINNGIMLIAAGVLLCLYFEPEMTRLYKKKWIPFACAFMIISSLIKMGLTYREYLHTRLPSRHELAKTILNKHTVTGDDLKFISPHGYSILIPRGYAYTEFDSGPFSLTALNGTSGIVVSRQVCPDALGTIVAETCRCLKQKNPTYVFSDQQSGTIGDIPTIRFNVSVTIETGPTEGFMLYFKKDSNLFQVILSCATVDFPENKPQFESIIKSLTI